MTGEPIRRTQTPIPMVPLQHCTASVLAAVLARQPTSPAKVAFAWRVAVGPALDRATAVALSGGVLAISVRDPHWRHEIERSAGLIVSRLQRLLGTDVVHRLVVHSTC